MTGSSERLLAAALRLYPRSFPEAMIVDITAVFHAEHEARLQRGPRPARLFLWRTLGAIAADALHERVVGPPARRNLPRAHPVDSLIQDATSAARRLLNAPLRPALAIGTLALGVGVGVAVLGVAQQIVLAPLPYQEPDQLVLIATTTTVSDHGTGIPLSALEDWRTVLSGAADAAGYASAEYLMDTRGDPRVIRAAIVSDGFFDTLRPLGLQGRWFGEQETVPAVVISDQLLPSLPNPGDPLGAALTIGGRTYAVTGVLPRSGSFPDEQIDVWMAARDVPMSRQIGGKDERHYLVLARLRHGVEPGDLQRLVQGQQDRNPAPNTGPIVIAERLRERLLGPAVPIMAICLLSALLVLVVACANATSLLVANAIERWREMAIRAALGATRARLFRGFVIEGLLFSVLVLAAGTVFAVMAMRGFATLGLGLPRSADLALQLPVFVAGFGTTLLVTLGSAVVAGARGLSVGSATMLRRGGVTGTTSRRFASVLIATQIAVSMVLLVSAGLLTRTASELLAADVGAVRTDVISTRVMLRQAGTLDAADHGPFVNALLRRLAELPGVDAAGLGSARAPDAGGAEMVITVIEGDQEDVHSFDLAAITPGYLEAMGIELIAGRELQDGDLGTSGLVTLISRSVADALFPGAEAVGLKLPMAFPFGNQQKARVIGVVGDVVYKGLGAPAAGSIYLPYDEMPLLDMYLAVRSEAGIALVPTIRALVHEMAPELAFSEIRSMEQIIADTVVEERQLATVARGFAGLAFVLALLGLFGAMARGVAEREREIAIRLALGATPRRIRALVLREGLVVTSAGLAVGAGIGLLAGQALASRLYGVAPWDPITIVSAAATILVATILATWIPARRATNASLGELLRSA